jgi:hypothetical protein
MDCRGEFTSDEFTNHLENAGTISVMILPCTNTYKHMRSSIIHFTEYSPSLSNKAHIINIG